MFKDLPPGETQSDQAETFEEMVYRCLSEELTPEERGRTTFSEAKAADEFQLLVRGIRRLLAEVAKGSATGQLPS